MKSLLPCKRHMFASYMPGGVVSEMISGIYKLPIADNCLLVVPYFEMSWARYLQPSKVLLISTEQSTINVLCNCVFIIGRLILGLLLGVALRGEVLMAKKSI